MNETSRWLPALELPPGGRDRLARALASPHRAWRHAPVLVATALVSITVGWGAIVLRPPSMESAIEAALAQALAPRQQVPVVAGAAVQRIETAGRLRAYWFIALPAPALPTSADPLQSADELP